MSIPSILVNYFAWPNGAVWGNVFAEPIIAGLTIAIVWPFRNHLMKRFVAFHHQHKMAHLVHLERQMERKYGQAADRTEAPRP